MIRWCCYCQAFLGERAPYDDPQFTHTICPACDAKLEQDAPLDRETHAVRELFRQILDRARSGDEHACAPLLERARELGLGTESVLVGLLQPALYQAGLDWQGGTMSVTAEHRLTRWCGRALALIPPAPRATPPIDLLIIQTPGNAHTLGARIAGRALEARGFAVEVVTPGVPVGEMIALARELRPAAIGFSCALPASVQVAAELIMQLRSALEGELSCRYLASGFAFRLEGADLAATLPVGVEIVLDLPSFPTRTP